MGAPAATFALVWLAATPLLAAQEAVTVKPGSVVRWDGDGVHSCSLAGETIEPLAGSCYLPIDLRRTGELVAERTVGDRRERIRLRIGEYPYDVQRLHIEDESKVFLSPEDLKRVERENARIGALWRRGAPRRFTLPLSPPLSPLPAGGRFGAKRIINGAPRSPHSGTDYGAATGTPVHAVAEGSVALAEEHFFGGNSVFLDHGDDLVSMYLHLDEILVEPGQEVARGAVIGRVGSSGRATGPHLHFALRWHAARIDPGLLLTSPESLPSLPPAAGRGAVEAARGSKPSG
jgi:murein DD-endopeptidase MepM/ murein hydrolase activator NlpD